MPRARVIRPLRAVERHPHRAAVETARVLLGIGRRRKAFDRPGAAALRRPSRRAADRPPRPPASGTAARPPAAVAVAALPCRAGPSVALRRGHSATGAGASAGGETGGAGAGVRASCPPRGAPCTTTQCAARVRRSRDRHRENRGERRQACLHRRRQLTRKVSVSAQSTPAPPAQGVAGVASASFAAAALGATMTRTSPVSTAQSLAAVSQYFEILHAQRQRDPLGVPVHRVRIGGVPSRQVDPPVRLQLLDRPARRGGVPVRHEQEHDLVAGALAGVGDVDGDVDDAGLRRRRCTAPAGSRS